MAKTILSNSEVLASIGLPADVVTKLTTTQGDTYKAVANEFLTALVNKIVYQKIANMNFSNPFKRFDGYPVEYGDTIENIFVDRQLGRKFDRTDTDPFSKSLPRVTSSYVSINYEMEYPLTIEDKDMRKACLSPNGFMRLTDALVNSLGTSMSVDEYLATIIMLNNSANYVKGSASNDLTGVTDDSIIADKVLHTIIDVAKDFTLPSVSNNVKKVMTCTPYERILLVIKQELLNKIDLDYLTGVFNLSKVDLVKNIIPVRSFQAVVNTLNGETLTPSVNGDDIDFVIMDSAGFDNHDALRTTGTIYNPRGLYLSFFSHLWKILSVRPDFQARAFKITK